MRNYPLEGVCAKSVAFDLIEGKVRNVSFENGCPGNLKAIALLVEGMTPEEIINRVKGVTCKDKTTSCSDQLAKVLSNL